MGDLMYANELERDFKLPESTWRFWHYSGRLRASKVGRRLIWKRAEVLVFLAEQGLDVGV